MNGVLGIRSTLREILVIGADIKEADLIAHELKAYAPDCQIYYSPNLQLSASILSRKEIELVITNNLIAKDFSDQLEYLILRATSYPKLLVLDNLGESENSSGLNSDHDPIAELGSDLRDKLNNYLQQIVSFVFAAQNSSGRDSTAALSYIDKAARDMANTVSGIEDQIREKLKIS
jgi:hypothetical protein